MARQLCAVPIVLCAVACAAPPPGALQIAPDAAFSVKDATQIMNFLAADDAVFASVRYEGPEVESPYRRGAGGPVMIRERRSALAAWDTDGRPLWQQDYPAAYKLALADDKLVLAHDTGMADGERGLIWIDSRTGREISRVKLSGRPCHMSYYPQADLTVLIVMPQHRLRTLEGAWMEVAAFDSHGRQAWLWKYDCTELAPLRMDGKALVVVASHAKAPAVVRLDPASGREMWRAKWDFGEAVESSAARAAGDSHESLVLVPMAGGVRFLDLATGRTVRDIPLPALGGRRAWAVEHYDRFYVTSDDLKGITLAAYAYPSGRLLWSDETGTVSYFGPVAWGRNVVFMARRLSEGLTGRTTVNELRAYGPDGKCLALVSGEAPSGESPFYWNDTLLPQVAGDRLYAAAGRSVLAMKWQPAPRP